MSDRKQPERKKAVKQINRRQTFKGERDERREVFCFCVLFPSALALCSVVKYTAVC